MDYPNMLITEPLGPPTASRERTASLGFQGARELHLVFKTHLDVGFTNFSRTVLHDYMDHFIPAAIDVAQSLRLAGRSERLIWTTGSWLIYEYLERNSPEKRALLEDAIAAGDITWHGLPFTTHTELLDPSLFRHGMSLSQQLDRRFGKRTIAAKMTDVPGHTRGLVPLLAEGGIQFLHIGVNPASTAPDVPPVFIWEHAGARVTVMYHAGSYGDLMLVPGLDAAIAFAHTGDNLGPQGEGQIIDVFQAMRARFPQANIHASTMDHFAAQLVEAPLDLPVVTAELGDTWIHGAGTDPLKVAQYRSLARLRNRWLEGRTEAAPTEAQLSRFSDHLIMVAEHTWGMDEKTHLNDTTHFAQGDFDAARKLPAFRKMEASWDEQRAYLTAAVEELGDSAAAGEARAALAECQPNLPAWLATSSALSPEQAIAPQQTAQFELRFDARTGALCHLQERAGGRVWASPSNPLALLSYETFSAEDYSRFWRQYVINKKTVRPWAWPDFTKPGMESTGARHEHYLPTLLAMHRHEDESGSQYLLELAGPKSTGAHYGCPARFTLLVSCPAERPEIHFDLQWRDKAACRLPEALWLSFAPEVRQPAAWRMEKLGSWLDPEDVVRNGNRRMHAVGRGLSYHDGRDTLELETLDAPLVAPGERALLNFTNRPAQARGGWHFNLYNNVWGTNFPMWYEDPSRFRFTLRINAPRWR